VKAACRDSSSAAECAEYRIGIAGLSVYQVAVGPTKGALGSSTNPFNTTAVTVIEQVVPLVVGKLPDLKDATPLEPMAVAGYGQSDLAGVVPHWTVTLTLGRGVPSLLLTTVTRALQLTLLP
jgi:hypothetical protein